MDALGLAAGAVLMQDQGQGLRPLAFMSQAMKPTKQRYSAYERELAAIMTTLFGRLPRRCHSYDGSQAVDPSDGSTSLVPVLD